MASTLASRHGALLLKELPGPAVSLLAPGRIADEPWPPSLLSASCVLRGDVHCREVGVAGQS